MSSPPYTRAVFSCQQRKRVVDWLVKHVVDLRAEAIVACGQSGLIPAAVVSHITDIPLVAIRKPGEPSNSGGKAHYVSERPAERWVIIDDLIASGGTVVNAMAQAKRCEAVTSVRPTAILLYHEDMGHSLVRGEEGRKTFSPARWHWEHMVQQHGASRLLWAPVDEYNESGDRLTYDAINYETVNRLVKHTFSIEVRHTWAD